MKKGCKYGFSMIMIGEKFENKLWISKVFDGSWRGAFMRDKLERIGKGSGRNQTLYL